jgi:hypothetical protein
MRLQRAARLHRYHCQAAFCRYPVGVGIQAGTAQADALICKPYCTIRTSRLHLHDSFDPNSMSTYVKCLTSTTFYPTLVPTCFIHSTTKERCHPTSPCLEQACRQLEGPMDWTRYFHDNQTINLLG